MSAPAWTPGPWAIMDEADPDLTVMSQATDCEMICHIPDVDFDSDAGTPHPVNVANARLIAAAPDFAASAASLIEAWDARTTGAQQIITGKSDADLQKQALAAIDGLRAALAKAGAA